METLNLSVDPCWEPACELGVAGEACTESGMANRDVLAIGTSAGGFGALRYLARNFPADLDATVLVTIHLSSQFPSALDEILTASGPLPASFAADGDALEKGRIYIAPPERHLIVDASCLRLGLGPRENGARPAIDPMFRSAALCCGPRSVGVILTGTLGDGASGLRALRLCGGITVVQDPLDAAFPEMPATALSRSSPSHVMDLAGMPDLLRSLVEQQEGEPASVPEELRPEVEIARSGLCGMSRMDRLGRRSVLTCPECRGLLWEIDEGGLARYRCHVGHAYTAEVMSLALDESLRRALASALRALDERTALARKLREEAIEVGRAGMAKSWAAREQELEKEADIIRASISRADEIAARWAAPGTA